MARQPQREVKARIISLIPRDNMTWSSSFTSVSKTETLLLGKGQEQGPHSQPGGPARTHTPGWVLTRLPDSATKPTEPAGQRSRIAALNNGSLHLFLSVCPSADHTAEAKTSISAEANPAASVYCLSVNRLREGLPHSSSHPVSGPPALSRHLPRK